jgi:hypothetical protein
MLPDLCRVKIMVQLNLLLKKNLGFLEGDSLISTQQIDQRIVLSNNFYFLGDHGNRSSILHRKDDKIDSTLECQHIGGCDQSWQSNTLGYRLGHSAILTASEC